MLRPHGVRGELRVELLTDYPHHLSTHDTLYVGEDTPYPLESIRLHQKGALVKLRGCDDRNAAEALRGQLLFVPREKAVPLEEGEYYHYQIVGMEVTTDQGDVLGKVTDVLATGANDVYVVRGAWGEVLLPAIDSVVRSLDVAARRMTVTLPPGLLKEE
ncbi:MAG: 16S rRNA processing protein RimM [Anaerolineae bacterium]|nr:16S rRNA processing protein RimM [Anaerolineae bacterium]